MKIRPVGAQVIHADGQTHRLTDVKLIIPFCNFANSPKSEYKHSYEKLKKNVVYQIMSTKIFFSLWRCDPTRIIASSFLRSLDHT